MLVGRLKIGRISGERPEPVSYQQIDQLINVCHCHAVWWRQRANLPILQAVEDLEPYPTLRRCVICELNSSDYGNP